MRKLLVLLICVITCFGSISAQKRNKHGLKVVSELELGGNNENSDIIRFKYDKDYNLTGIVVYYDNKILISYELVNGKIIGKSYTDCGSTDFSFTLDEERNLITSLSYVSYESLKYRRDYYYEYDYIENQYKLSSEVLHEIHYNHKTKRYNDEPYFSTTFKYNNINGTIAKFINTDDFLNYDLINDTNISLYTALSRGFRHGKLSYLMITEWINTHNYYLMKDFLCDHYHYKYDLNGNLIEAAVYWYSEIPQIKVKIKYLY